MWVIALLCDFNCSLWFLPLLAVLLNLCAASKPPTLTAGNVLGILSEWCCLKTTHGCSRNAECSVFIQTPILIYGAAVIGAVLVYLGGLRARPVQISWQCCCYSRRLFCGELLCFSTSDWFPVRDLNHWHGVIDDKNGDGFDPFSISRFQTGFLYLFMRHFIVGFDHRWIYRSCARWRRDDGKRYFWHVVLPLVRPALAALSVLIFTFIWNDYFWALVTGKQSDEVCVLLTAGISA